MRYISMKMDLWVSFLQFIFSYTLKILRQINNTSYKEGFRKVKRQPQNGQNILLKIDKF